MNPILENASIEQIVLEDGVAEKYSTETDNSSIHQELIVAPNGLTDDDFKQLERDAMKSILQQALRANRQIEAEIEQSLQEAQEVKSSNTRSASMWCNTSIWRYRQGSGTRNVGDSANGQARSWAGFAGSIWTKYKGWWRCERNAAAHGQGTAGYSDPANWTQYSQATLKVCLNGWNISDVTIGGSIASDGSGGIEVSSTSSASSQCIVMPGSRMYNSNLALVSYGGIRGSTRGNFDSITQETLGMVKVHNYEWPVNAYAQVNK